MTARAAVLAIAATWGIGAAGLAHAQARPLPPGVGSFSLGYQWIDNTGHRLSDGYFLHQGFSINRSLASSFEYGVSERLTLSAGLPYVRAKYTDPLGPPANLPVDTEHHWHDGLQDFAVSARFGALSRGPLAVSAAASVVLPSHDYNYQGEAVVGRNLKELQIGVHAARTLDELTPRLEVLAGYTYAFVEKAEVDVKNDRSNFYGGLSFLVTERLQVHGVAAWQRTHGGLRFGDGPGGSFPPLGDVNTPERLAEHDRLLRDNNLHLEAGLTYSLGPVDVSGTYVAYASGTDTHAGHALSLGATLYFGRLPGRQPAP